MEVVNPRRNNVRLWILAESGLLCGLGLIAIFWLIPAETTGGGIGLSSSALPTVCVAAAMALIALDAVVRLAGWISPVVETQPPAGPALRVIALCVIGAVLLQVMNPAICTALLIPPLMMLLGERSVVRIAATTVITATILAAALAWRG